MLSSYLLKVKSLINDLGKCNYIIDLFDPLHYPNILKLFHLLEK